MSDLFSAADTGAGQPAPAAAKTPSLHSDTAIYRAVIDLGAFAVRATANMHRPARELLGKMIVEETIYMAATVRKANIARGPEKLPLFDYLLNQTEVVQVGFRIARDARVLANKAWQESLPLTANVARQATALRKSFASLPAQ